jgi:uncharacterized repeat protein (TIGR03847 family)
VRSITLDAVGVPGARTFYMQAQYEDGKLISILLEKTQAILLAEQIDALLDSLAQRNPPLTEHAQVPELQHPEQVMFRAGKLGLQYDADVDLVRLEVAELRGIGQGSPAVLRVWTTRQQMRVLSDRAQRVLRGGLPTGDLNPGLL